MSGARLAEQLVPQHGVAALALQVGVAVAQSAAVTHVDHPGRGRRPRNAPSESPALVPTFAYESGMDSRDPARAPVFLIGAGASREAGLPVSVEITRQFLDDQSRQFTRYRSVSALRFVVGALVAHDARAGGRPDELPDIERVASAVELLAQRAELEVAPFVANWDPTVDGLERGAGASPAFIQHDLERGLGLGRMGRSGQPDLRALQGAIEKLIDARAQGESLRTFEILLDQLIGGLARVLGLADGDHLDYLKPLLSATPSHSGAPLVIGTLNYDLAIELLAKRQGLEVHRGVENWAVNGTLNFPDSGLHLLKLHGSLDWRRTQGSASYEDPAVPTALLTVDPDGSGPPFVVFGQREKLRPHGPFLELLEQFRRSLALANDLIVIGYSFRDEHINELIARWLNGQPQRRITVVDPGFPERNRDRSFPQTLIRHLRQAGPARLPEDDERPVRLAILRQTTGRFLASIANRPVSEFLGEIFGDEPTGR